MLTVPMLLVVLALILTVASAMGRAPLWTAVFVLCVYLLLQVWR